jgi:HlyD family secretion protein
MKKLIFGLIGVAAVGISVGAYYNLKKTGAPPEVTTAKITRGSVVDTVGATGTLEAVTTVQVGSQVSGTVQQLYADFNSIVHKGQVIARLDPSLLQTQIEQQKANLIRAEADLERLKVSLEDARTKLTRAEDLARRNLIPPQDLETAQVNARSIEAQIKSSEAQVTQARASLNQAQVNLEHTVITAPIDGIVISRNVDVGQTVAASMQAPVLYLLAADLTKMQVNASIDESDVGRIRPGQVVRFRVDAYPTEEFMGTVTQVRLQPVVVQNVVTYTTIIDVPNRQLKLKPGMTANVNIEIARADNVLRISSAALRFRPTADMFMALNLPVPEDIQRQAQRAANAGQRGGGASGQGQDAEPATPTAGATTTPGTSLAQSGAETIDALFAPIPRRQTPGLVWLWVDNELKSVRVRLGVSDGTNTELTSDRDEIKPDLDVVTGILMLTTTRQGAGATGGAAQNPLIPQRGGRGR